MNLNKKIINLDESKENTWSNFSDKIHHSEKNYKIQNADFSLFEGIKSNGFLKVENYTNEENLNKYISIEITLSEQPKLWSKFVILTINDIKTTENVFTVERRIDVNLHFLIFKDTIFSEYTEYLSEATLILNIPQGEPITIDTLKNGFTILRKHPYNQKVDRLNVAPSNLEEYSFIGVNIAVVIAFQFPVALVISLLLFGIRDGKRLPYYSLVTICLNGVPLSLIYPNRLEYVSDTKYQFLNFWFVTLIIIYSILLLASKTRSKSSKNDIRVIMGIFFLFYIIGFFYPSIFPYFCGVNLFILGFENWRYSRNLNSLIYTGVLTLLQYLSFAYVYFYPKNSGRIFVNFSDVWGSFSVLTLGVGVVCVSGIYGDHLKPKKRR